MSESSGYVYLLHFRDRINPAYPCQHYLGFAKDLKARLEEHHHGGPDASRLCQVARERGIPFTVVRVWSRGSRKLERRLKRRHNGRRLCPVCSGSTGYGSMRGELSSAEIIQLLMASGPDALGADDFLGLRPW
jgi:putative endonuclease